MQNTEMDRSSPPLGWMVLQAGVLGLCTKPFERELSPHKQINVTESLTWVWWPLELWPFHRLTYMRGAMEQRPLTSNSSPTAGNTSTNCFFRPHCGTGRKIHANQKIHVSLLLAGSLMTGYTPKAWPLDDNPSFWETARWDGLGDWLELDLYDVVHAHVGNFIIDHDSTVWQILRQTVTWGKLALCLRIFHSSHMATFSGWMTSTV